MFDGRLLHGAPSHRSLLRQECKVGSCGNKDLSSLRVTFLVNIWRSGRPAGVGVLPRDIREEIMKSAAESQATRFDDAVPLEFRPRSLARLSVNPSGEDQTKPAGDKDIILPFVSAGATGIDGDEDKEDKADEETKSSREPEIIEAGSSNDPADGEHDGIDKAIGGESEEEEEEAEEDGDLVLALPPFDTSEYLDEEADTIVLSFKGENEARLVRVGAGEESEEEN